LPLLEPEELPLDCPRPEPEDLPDEPELEFDFEDLPFILKIFFLVKEFV
jgi:hypothetical protein